MEGTERTKTLEVLPRYLCLAIEEGRDRFYFSPATDVLGNAFRRSPRIVSRLVQSTGRYKKWQHQEQENGRSYEPKFPWPEELLLERNESFPGILREAVKKKDGTYILFDAEPHEAIQDLTIKGNVVTSSVKSKSGRRPPHDVVIRDAFVDENGSYHIVARECACSGYVHDLEKGGRSIRGSIDCIHISATNDEVMERLNLRPPWKKPMKTEGEIPNTPVFSPFSFASNWVYRNGMYQPKDKHLAALEGDVLMTYYVIGEENGDIAGIDERLLTISECYSPSMLEWIRQGKVTRRIVGQRRKIDEVDLPTIKEERELSKGFDTELRKRGYDYDGMCRELGKIARRYIHPETGTSVNVVFSSTSPPFYTVRERLDWSPVNTTGEYSGEANPFKLIGKRSLRAFDDVTMRDTKLKVEAITSLRMPGSEMIDMAPSKRMRKRIRDEIRKAHGGEVAGTEKYARVHYAD